MKQMKCGGTKMKGENRRQDAGGGEVVALSAPGYRVIYETNGKTPNSCEKRRDAAACGWIQ